MIDKYLEKLSAKADEFASENPNLAKLGDDLVKKTDSDEFFSSGDNKKND